MKRILLSIAIAFAFVIFYLTIVTIIRTFVNHNNPLIFYLNLPVRFPQAVYFYFSPASIDTRGELTKWKVILAALFFIVDVLVYSIPAYFILRFISRFKKYEPLPTVEPPPPPKF